MRYTTLPFLFCLSLWVGAQPLLGAGSAPAITSNAGATVAAGQMITVRVDGAPSNTTFASFDLSPRIRGLQLYNAGHGRWEGSFAVLPSMVGQKFQPQASLFDDARHSTSVQGLKSVSTVVASSEASGEGVIAETTSGRTAVAFDDTVRLDTVEVRYKNEKASFNPELKNNYLLLPETLKGEDIVSVTALNLQGDPVTIHGRASSSLSMAPR